MNLSQTPPRPTPANPTGPKPSGPTHPSPQRPTTPGRAVPVDDLERRLAAAFGEPGSWWSGPTPHGVMALPLP